MNKILSWIRAEKLDWMPPQGWWLGLAAAVATGLLLNWGVAAGLVALLLAQAARPFDFILAYMILVAGASWVSNTGGALTFELSLLTLVILLVFAFYVITNPRRLIAIPRSIITWPLLLYLFLSVANAARGLASGYPPRYLGLEFIALLALGMTLPVANRFDRRRDLRLAIGGLIVVGFATAARAFVTYSVELAHTVAIYTVAAPGIVGLLLINLALRSETRLKAILWTLLSLPLFLHQLITFGRGLWTGCMAGLLTSALIYGGFRRGAGVRWARVGLIVALVVLLILVGAIQAAVFFGQADLLNEAWIRLTSITSTKKGIETRSNMIRLFEYGVVIGLIQKSPWIGYGVGYTFPVKEPFSGTTADQWGVHQNFLLVWLKQGAVGLILFIWLLVAAIRLGAREARRREDPLEATWFATTAVATVFLAVFSLSNYPFAVVNETFLLALLWGGSMAMSHTGFLTLRWNQS